MDIKWGLQFSMYLSAFIRGKHVKIVKIRIADLGLNGKSVFLFSTELVILKNLQRNFGVVK